VFLRICSIRKSLSSTKNHVSNIFPCKRFLKSCGSFKPSSLMMSSFTLGVAVAVKARGTLGKCVLSWKFSNRLDENHVPIAKQWASSMVIKLMGRFFSLHNPV
jgi:hypothetical protein